MQFVLPSTLHDLLELLWRYTAINSPGFCIGYTRVGKRQRGRNECPEARHQEGRHHIIENGNDDQIEEDSAQSVGKSCQEISGEDRPIRSIVERFLIFFRLSCFHTRTSESETIVLNVSFLPLHWVGPCGLEPPTCPMNRTALPQLI